ncbi:hypothetical protein CCHR01_19582 [Colletotrichum chrysophilum]|uniref:Uncharacterized protein n=1 Tax=Colletotrichum chrysophilum TaxID=1836956 RepID=A0AAD9E7P4_9PEZI|nr:hypothetical protein CCHR01_19582 [Colletotrichum chrysophilum]
MGAGYCSVACGLEGSDVYIIARDDDDDEEEEEEEKEASPDRRTEDWPGGSQGLGVLGLMTVRLHGVGSPAAGGLPGERLDLNGLTVGLRSSSPRFPYHNGNLVVEVKGPRRGVASAKVPPIFSYY